MVNVVGDVVENLGGLVSGTARQVGGLPIEIVKTAAGQIKGTNGNADEQSTAPAQDRAGRPGGASPAARQLTSRARNLLASDQRFAAKRISEIRAAIASGNKQIITSQTTQEGNRSQPGRGPIVPQTRRPTRNDLPVTARQGQGAGEITRGVVS